MNIEGMHEINNLDGHAFENLIYNLLIKMGLEVEASKKSNDGGIDITAKSDDPITGGLYIIQCKRYSSKVGEPVVRDLYGVINHINASKGVLITNSDFSKQAIDFANGKPLELINGDKLRELLTKYGLVGEIPDNKIIANIPHHQKTFTKRLMVVVQNVERTLEIEKIQSIREKEFYSVIDYCELNGEIMERFTHALQDFANATEYFTEKNQGKEDDYIDISLKVIKNSFNEILDCKKTLLGIELASEFELLNIYTVELFDHTLSQLINFCKQISNFTEIDGELVDKDTDRSIVLDLEATEQFEKIMKESKRINKILGGENIEFE